MKCSVQSIAAGDAAYADELNRLQRRERAVGPRADHGDPLLRELPAKPRHPSEVEMLVEGLREMEMEGE
ncbi:hypothetical protein LCGC14_1036250 [marine sediment metagenome]|uniref:Uncharacterized protein n=1 Tax=marine sediment metagenome TaxID=412755 RepID=A0A0F9QBB4_9ZZZZ